MKPYTARAFGREIVVDAATMRRPRVHLQQGPAGKAAPAIQVLQFLLRSIFRLVFRVHVVGLAHVPRTPVIICFNHLGWAEAFLVLLFFPVEPRIYGIGHQHVSELSGFRHWLIDQLQLFVPIDPSKPFLALRTAEDVLKRGGALLISPRAGWGTAKGISPRCNPARRTPASVPGCPCCRSASPGRRSCGCAGR
jgi:hypothetical protein